MDKISLKVTRARAHSGNVTLGETLHCEAHIEAATDIVSCERGFSIIRK